MRDKRKLRAVTLMLALVLTILSFPLESMAEVIRTKGEPEAREAEIISGESWDETVYILAEDNSKRGEYEKHYYLSDGSFAAVTYPEAVHYLDVNGEWQDIDNSLALNQKSGAYEASNGDFSVMLSDITAQSKADLIAKAPSVSEGIQANQTETPDSIDRAGALISLRKGADELSWTLTANKKQELTGHTAAAGKVTGSAGTSVSVKETRLEVSCSSRMQILGEEREQLSGGREVVFKKTVLESAEAFALPLISNKVEYTGIFGEDEGVSVRYTIYRNKIEEDIFIEKKTDIDSFTMAVNSGDLTAVLNEDKSVDFVDENGETVYHVSIPYMVDAAHAVLNDIEVRVEREEGISKITYTPESEWLNSEERVYPIMLDPSVTTNEYSAAIVDTYVEENTTVKHTNEQYLYINKNGSNRRKAVMSVMNLPKIDNSMPIISVKLNMSAQYGALTDIPLKLEIINGAYEAADATYASVAAASKRAIGYTTLIQYQSSVSFELTNELVELYNVVIPVFVISYANENSNDYCSPIYSSEYTNITLRPALTVKYGYTLPAGLADGNVISIENVGSGGSLYPHSGFTGDGINILHSYASNLSSAYQFILEKNSETGGYSLRHNFDPSVNAKVTADPSGRCVFRRTDNPQTQEWLIVPYDDNEFKIVLRSDMRLAMTAVGTPKSTNSDTSTTTNGHVIASMNMTPVQDNQLWYIIRNGAYLNTGNSRSVLETGDYYFNNAHTGKFLHRTGNSTIDGQSGFVSSLGDTIKWHVTNLGDGYCTIQRTDIPNVYLAADSANNSAVRLRQSSSESISDLYKWSIRIATGRGCFIKNKSTGKYLYSSGYTSNPSSVSLTGQYLSGENYDKQRWRVVEASNYKELDNGVSFDDIVLEIGSTKAPVINKSPANALWANLSDFTYTITSGNQYVLYNTDEHTFTGVSHGNAMIKAIHKVTGITKYFVIKVLKNAIIIVPGIMGSQIFTTSEIVIDGKTVAAGTRIWDPETDPIYEILSADEKVLALAMTPSGNPIYPTGVRNPIINYCTDNENECRYGAQNMYSEIYKKMYTDFYPKGYDIVLYEYDWRYDPYQTALLLNNFITEKEYGNIIFIAHSMGV